MKDRPVHRPLRRPRAPVWVSLVLAFAMLISLLAQAQASIEEEIGRKAQELQGIESRMGEVETQLKETEQSVEQTRRDLTRIEREMEQVRSELAVLQDRLRRTANELSEAEQRLIELQARMKEREQVLGQRLRTLYEEGRVTYLEVLLGAESFADFVSRFDLLRTVVALDVGLLRGARADRDEMAAHKEAVLQQRNEVADLQRQSAERAAAVEAAAAAKASQVQLLSARQMDLKEMYEQLEQESDAIGTRIAELQRESERQAGILRFDFPVWPVYTTSPYGMRWHPVYGGYRMHTGTDFSAYTGQNVYAAERGTVILSRYYGGYGYAVIIDHGSGISSLYAHNSRLLVQEGDEVERGDVISLAGSTGLSTGPHVHLEIREYGDPVDPMGYLPGL